MPPRQQPTRIVPSFLSARDHRANRSFTGSRLNGVTPAKFPATPFSRRAFPHDGECQENQS